MIEPVTSTTVWLRRLWPAAALGAGTIVVGLGTATLVALQPPASPAPSRAVLALRSAHDDAVRLADLARAAGQAAAAQVLDRQAAVLAAAPGVANASHSAGSPTSSSTTAAHDLADGLSASVAARLAALVDVDGPTSTVLASVAAGQSLQLDGVAKATGQTPSVPAASPPASPSPTLNRTCTASSPSPSANRASTNPASANPASTALATVARAERASVYVLETALARTPAGSGEAVGRTAALDGHRKQLVEVTTLATALCSALPPMDPAFAVPADFAANPDPAVGAAAGSAEQAWAQLVGTLPPASRSSAASGLLTAARLAQDTAAPFPGIPAAAAPAS
jgi:hypothetical protein